MTSRTVEEVQSIFNFFHRYGILLSTVLQDKLLEVQESSLVRHFLSDLDNSLPGILCGQLRAIRTLTILNKVLNLKGLLEYRIRQNLVSNMSMILELQANAIYAPPSE